MANLFIASNFRPQAGVMGSFSLLIWIAI